VIYAAQQMYVNVGLLCRLKIRTLSTCNKYNKDVKKYNNIISVALAFTLSCQVLAQFTMTFDVICKIEFNISMFCFVFVFELFLLFF
jgi:hypothetical protein